MAMTKLFTQVSKSFKNDSTFKEYVDLASRNEDLKSEERVLNTALENIKEIKTLLIEKEKKFCNKDSRLRASNKSGKISINESLRKRCHHLIDHLVHYKCVIECLSGDVLTMESNLINDDEFIHLSLMFRDAELSILQSIKINQKRNEIFLNLHEEESEAYLREVEPEWRIEHQQRRKSISKLILDHNQVLVDKTRKNLQEQQKLLNQRYQSINNLIKMSYGFSHLNDLQIA